MYKDWSFQILKSSYKDTVTNTGINKHIYKGDGGESLDIDPEH